ncbi:MAG: helix-turn-helix domain-containing protein [Deltaproteobacteria bacterium]|nr:helix-turn-helix domain-containing protein [Deltaproteobacteria bacterium]
MEFELLLRQLGRRVRATRKSLGWSQDSAAARAGIDDKFLQRIEAGKQAITLRTLHRLAQALRTTVASLLAGRDDIGTFAFHPGSHARAPLGVNKNRDESPGPRRSLPVPYPRSPGAMADAGAAADAGPHLRPPPAPASGRATQRELQAFLNALGARCREVRTAQGLQPADLRSAGWSRQYLHRLESGHGLTVATLLRLARAYGVHPSDLLPLLPVAIPSPARTPRRR